MQRWTHVVVSLFRSWLSPLVVGTTDLVLRFFLKDLVLRYISKIPSFKIRFHVLFLCSSVLYSVFINVYRTGPVAST